MGRKTAYRVVEFLGLTGSGCEARCATALLLLLLTTCSCEKAGQQFKLVSGSVDIKSFIITEVMRYRGKAVVRPSNANHINIPYEYRPDKNGCRLFCDGDRVVELASILAQAYGPAALAWTNKVGRGAPIGQLRRDGTPFEQRLSTRIGSGSFDEGVKQFRESYSAVFCS